MDYWMNTRGFALSGTSEAGVMLASKPKERKFLLVREDWFTGELRQFTPIQSSEAEALAFLNSSNLVSA
jgi:hypothetical protein